MNTPAAPTEKSSAGADGAGPILCFGEILWDFLPDGLYPGGAPFNVGFHLHQLGQPVHLVSAVGADTLGDELLRRLRHAGLPTDGVARHEKVPTGTVRAALGATGDARYEIVAGVAWDQIEIRAVTFSAATLCRALIFGSLAQRSPFNRASLETLFPPLPKNALRVFDVNLRPPHDDPALALALARKANVLKLNAAEAARLAAHAPETPGREEAHARQLAATTGCAIVCVTAGARGAGVWSDGRWTWQPGRPVVVADTVGAGDAFLAALVDGLLETERTAANDALMLSRACRLGEWVATQRGATPAHPRPPSGDGE